MPATPEGLRKYHRSRWLGLTDVQRDILAFCRASPLRGSALTRALANARGCRFQSADGHLQRLTRKGYLQADGTLTPLVALLQEIGRFLAARSVAFVSGDHAYLMHLRERIVQNWEGCRDCCQRLTPGLCYETSFGVSR